MSTSVMPKSTFGSLMREWRQRRHLSQLALALKSDVSQRHLSFVESGRATPSREMVVRLAEQLDVPLRARNQLLLSAGYAPLYLERPIGDPALGAARAAVLRVLDGHEPFPALAMDCHWYMVDANQSLRRFLGGVAAELLQPPVNVLRISLHPDALAPRIVNLPQWRAHLLPRLESQLAVSADPQLTDLLAEPRDYPSPCETLTTRPRPDDGAGVLIPFQLRMDDGSILSFISTTTVFGTPTEITLAEIALECFFPADPETAAYLRRAEG